MRFIMLVKASRDSEAGVMPGEALIAAMAEYHQALDRAGVLVDASGLKPSRQGWRIRYDGAQRSVTDGPFAETKELVAGYTIIDVASEAEARDWSLRYPNPAGDAGVAEIEVRPFYELEDFEPSEALEKFRELDKSRAERGA